jgi:hypothetical protein
MRICRSAVVFSWLPLSGNACNLNCHESADTPQHWQRSWVRGSTCRRTRLVWESPVPRNHLAAVSSSWRRVTELVLAVAASTVIAQVTGCTAPQPLDPKARPLLLLEMSEPLIVINEPVRQVRAVPGADGQVHVLAITANDKSLHHIVVGQHGVESRETVMRGLEFEQPVLALPGPVNNLAAAVDADGTLRVVFRTAHLSMRDGKWSGPTQGPPCETLVRSGSVLHCAYRETGGVHGASTRLQWYLIAPSPIPLPVPQQNTKLLLACRSSSDWIPWAIFEPEARRDIAGFVMNGDGAGGVNAIYIGGSTLRPLGGDEVMVASTPSMPECNDDVSRRGLSGVPGISTRMAFDGASQGSIAIATDLDTGNSLALVSGYGYVESFWLAKNAISEKRSYIWGRDGNSYGARLWAAGAGGFHAAYMNNRADSYYLAYAGGKWSQPVLVFPAPLAGAVPQGADRLLVFTLGRDQKQLVAKWLKPQPLLQ